MQKQAAQALLDVAQQQDSAVGAHHHVCELRHRCYKAEALLRVLLFERRGGKQLLYDQQGRQDLACSVLGVATLSGIQGPVQGELAVNPRHLQLAAVHAQIWLRSRAQISDLYELAARIAQLAEHRAADAAALQQHGKNGG